MNLVKNEQQIEFADLVTRARDHGMNDSRIAEALEIGRSQISKYGKGLSTPPKDKLKLLRLILDGMDGRTAGAQYKYPPPAEEEIAGMDDPEVRSACCELRELHARDPAQFATVRTVIGTFYGKKPRPPAKPEPARKSTVSSAEAAENDVIFAAVERAQASPPDGPRRRRPK